MIHSTARIFPHSEINFTNSDGKFYCQKARVSCGSVTLVFSLIGDADVPEKNVPPQAAKMQLSKVITASEQLGREQKCPWLLRRKTVN